MGPKGEKGSSGPDLSSKMRSLEGSVEELRGENSVLKAELSRYNETLSAQRDKIYLLEREKGDLLKLN